MTKSNYEVSYNLNDAKTGKVRDSGHKTVVQAESETNAIAEVKKRYKSDRNLAVEIVTVKLKK